MSPAETKPLPEIEYRVLWVEYPCSGTGVIRVPFSGPVGDFASAHADYLAKADTYGCHDVLIEARVKSDAAWPHPEERPERWRL